jgi:hypothetical protein
MIALFIFAAIGLLIHWASLFNSAYRKPDFSMRIFFDKNWLAMFIQAFVVVLCVYDKRISDFIGYSIETPTQAAMMGFNASVIWNIIRKFKKPTQ